MTNSELRALCLAATPGSWTYYDDSNDGKTNRMEIVAIGKTITRIYQSVPAEDGPNAAYIAAMSPDTTLALLDEIERLRALLRDAKEAHLEAIYSMTTKAYNMAKASVAAIEQELSK